MNNDKLLNINHNLYSRRDFIKDIAKGVSYVTVGSLVVSQFNACNDESNPASSSNGNNSDATITIDISLAINNSLKNIGGSIIISGNNIDENGMLIIRTGESSVTALSRTCTHQGCILPIFQSGSSRCPCHGSRFDTLGNVLNGPATTPLKKYNATIDGNIITIVA